MDFPLKRGKFQFHVVFTRGSPNFCIHGFFHGFKGQSRAIHILHVRILYIIDYIQYIYWDVPRPPTKLDFLPWKFHKCANYWQKHHPFVTGSNSPCVCLIFCNFYQGQCMTHGYLGIWIILAENPADSKKTSTWPGSDPLKCWVVKYFLHTISDSWNVNLELKCIYRIWSIFWNH